MLPPKHFLFFARVSILVCISNALARILNNFRSVCDFNVSKLEIEAFRISKQWPCVGHHNFLHTAFDLFSHSFLAISGNIHTTLICAIQRDSFWLCKKYTINLIGRAYELCDIWTYKNSRGLLQSFIVLTFVFLRIWSIRSYDRRKKSITSLKVHQII